MTVHLQVISTRWHKETNYCLALNHFVALKRRNKEKRKTLDIKMLIVHGCKRLPSPRKIAEGCRCKH